MSLYAIWKAIDEFIISVGQHGHANLREVFGFPREEREGMRLVRTCTACPEQYDVFEGRRLVGYLRLRHGRFTAHYGSSAGPVVYEAFTRGDGLFDDEAEREEHLKAAQSALRAEDALKQC